MKYEYRRIRDLREDHDFKQEYVAHYLGIKQQQYQRYESGVIEIPLHIAIDLAILYDVSLDYLVGMDKNK